MTWVGVSIALFGALGYALGAALQQFEAVRSGATLKLMRRPRFCALVFQTAWLREFRLIFGATTPASAAVLAMIAPALR